jgi:hypothetical protein
MLTSTKNFTGAILIADLPAVLIADLPAVLIADSSATRTAAATGLARVVVAAAATSNLAALARCTAAALVLTAADNADRTVEYVIRTREDALLEAVDAVETAVLDRLDNVLHALQGACGDIH